MYDNNQTGRETMELGCVLIEEWTETNFDRGSQLYQLKISTSSAVLHDFMLYVANDVRSEVIECSTVWSVRMDTRLVTLLSCLT